MNRKTLSSLISNYHVLRKSLKTEIFFVVCVINIPIMLLCELAESAETQPKHERYKKKANKLEKIKSWYSKRATFKTIGKYYIGNNLIW